MLRIAARSHSPIPQIRSLSSAHALANALTFQKQDYGRETVQKGIKQLTTGAGRKPNKIQYLD